MAEAAGVVEEVGAAVEVAVEGRRRSRRRLTWMPSSNRITEARRVRKRVWRRARRSEAVKVVQSAHLLVLVWGYLLCYRELCVVVAVCVALSYKHCRSLFTTTTHCQHPTSV